MKKWMVSLAAALFSFAAASAQDAVGLRAGAWWSGYNAEVSFQRAFSYDHRMELDLGLSSLSRTPVWFDLTGAFHWRGPIAGNLNWFVGPAASVRLSTEPRFALAAGAQGGVEYEFGLLPFQISLDFRPMWNVVGGSGFFGTGLGLRYML